MSFGSVTKILPIWVSEMKPLHFKWGPAVRSMWTLRTSCFSLANWLFIPWWLLWIQVWNNSSVQLLPLNKKIKICFHNLIIRLFYAVLEPPRGVEIWKWLYRRVKERLREVPRDHISREISLHTIETPPLHLPFHYPLYFSFRFPLHFFYSPLYCHPFHLHALFLLFS